ncbi:MAG: isoprenylcysteine carboxylmethyltransferase family protein [Myxococcales bacterium]|nr:isoprenylcysteine carboxylmethyltransferase family protein [Myxococcales bacterium]
MTMEERQLAVLVVLSLTVGLRLLAHGQAGGMFRDQSDGVQAEGGTAVAVLLRLVFLAGGLGGVLAWWVDPGWLPGALVLPGWASWLGLGMAELGVLLLAWVHMALGVHFSGTLHLRDDHQLVRTGPYARVRHPMYTSFLLLFTGLSLLTGNVLIAAVLLGSQVWVLWWRLPVEEAQLAQRFGAAWPAYVARTGALLPRVS